MRKIIFCILLITTSCLSDEKHGQAETTEVSVDSEELQLATARKIIEAHKADAAVDAGVIFRQRCAVCHGIKGNLGVNGAGDLTKSGLNLEERVAIIYFGKNTMTPFKDVLTESEIVELALYVALLRQG